VVDETVKLAVPMGRSFCAWFSHSLFVLWHNTCPTALSFARRFDIGYHSCRFQGEVNLRQYSSRNAAGENKGRRHPKKQCYQQVSLICKTLGCPDKRPQQ
jgi:hypothetical protein